MKRSCLKPCVPIGVFVLAALTNFGLGSTISNYKCLQGSCTSITQRCAGTGSCDWCNVEDPNVKLCGVWIQEKCESYGNGNCGENAVRYTGQCFDGICTGTQNPRYGCTWPGCLTPT